MDDQSGDGRDLGFNLYNGDLEKTVENRLNGTSGNFMLRKLNLKPGDRLIDVGCGYGDWLNYARSKGIEVMGVNISPGQAKIARDRYGLDIIVSNWKAIPQGSGLTGKTLRRLRCRHLYGYRGALCAFQIPDQ